MVAIGDNGCFGRSVDEVGDPAGSSGTELGSEIAYAKRPDVTGDQIDGSGLGQRGVSGAESIRVPG
jgi:hypothetical protein